MLKVLNGESNGAMKDKSWGWKSGAEWRKGKETTQLSVKRELRDLDGEKPPFVGQAKL